MRRVSPGLRFISYTRESQVLLAQECTECMTCVSVCPVNAISFGLKQPFFDRPASAGLDISRRSLIKSAIAGVAVVPLFKLNFKKWTWTNL